MEAVEHLKIFNSGAILALQLGGFRNHLLLRYFLVFAEFDLITLHGAKPENILFHETNFQGRISIRNNTSG